MKQLNEQFINENRSSKNRSKARRYLRGVGYSDDKVGELEKELIATFSPYIRDSDFKFMLGVARFTHQGKIRTGDDISKVKDLIKHINMSHLEEYDNDFNGEDFETLHGRFETAIEQDYEKDQETLATRDFGGKSDYEVVKISSYDEGRPYSKYTSWCVLGGEHVYNSYTSNGLGIFYFLLKDGYEDIPRERGDNAPKDEYGMSMIAVSVDEFGRLNSSTTRWNHECGGSDNMFTTEELSRLVGQNFYSVFKPRYTKEEIVQKIYNEGEKIEKGELSFIYFNKKYYLLDNEEKISLKKYFDNIGEYENGFINIKIINKGWNFINKNGEFIRNDLWFDDTREFTEGFASVYVGNKGWNFINTKGEILRDDLWFDGTSGFSNGFSSVEINYKFNFINTKGEILRNDLWFDYAGGFNNGIARVEMRNKGWNLINTKGKILNSKLWFDHMLKFREGFWKVYIKNKGWNFINTKGEILRDDLWFYKVGGFNEGFAAVEIKKGWNFINTKGEWLNPKVWFDEVDDFEEGVARVRKIGMGWNIINKQGRLSIFWFDSVSNFHDGFALVYKNVHGYKHKEENNFISKYGELLSHILWFKKVGIFTNGFAEISFETHRISIDKIFGRKISNRFYINTEGEFFFRDKETKIPDNIINKLKEIRYQMSESLQIKQIINETINEYLLKNK